MTGPNRIRQTDARMADNYRRRFQKIPFQKRRQRLDLKSPKTLRQKEMARLIIAKKDLVAKFKKLRPRALMKVASDGSGVNYEYQFNAGGKTAKVTIDFKFSFGEAGNGTIGLRVENRRLVNSADWAFVMDKEGKISAFEVRHLHDFVRTKWGSVSQKKRLQKSGYIVYPVALETIYKSQGVKPLTAELRTDSIERLLGEIAAPQIKAAERPLLPRPKPATRQAILPAKRPATGTESAKRRRGFPPAKPADTRAKIRAFRPRQINPRSKY